MPRPAAILTVAALRDSLDQTRQLTNTHVFMVLDAKVFAACRSSRRVQAMSRVVVLLAVLALSIQADAVSNIVAFGDSLTDDCTHGASALVDSVLDTNQVSVQPC